MPVEMTAIGPFNLAKETMANFCRRVTCAQRQFICHDGNFFFSFFQNVGPIDSNNTLCTPFTLNALCG